jgi:Fe-S oxidoreductase
MAWCCGSGGGVSTAFPDLATFTAEERVREAEATGSSVLVTACPWCEYGLKDGIENVQSNMALVDIAELVYKSMKKNGNQ